jgi:hypothetical protein
MSAAAPSAGRSRGRSASASVLSVFAAVAILLASVAGIAHTVILSPDTLASVVSPIGASPQVRGAVADAAAAEVVSALDIEGRAKGLLGSPLGDVAGPAIARAVQARLSSAIEDELASPAFAARWRSAIDAASAAAVDVLKGDTNVVATRGGVVYLNVLPAIAGTLESLRGQGLLGASSQLPDLSDPATPALTMIAALSTALGLLLPPDFGQVAIVRTAALEQAQAAVGAIEATALMLVLAAVGLTTASVALALDRPGTVIRIGIAAALAVGVVPPLLRLAEGAASASLAAPGMAVVAAAFLDAIVDAVSWPLRAVSAACLAAALAAFLAAVVGPEGVRRRADAVALLIAAGFAAGWAVAGPDAALLGTAIVVAVLWSAWRRQPAPARG